MDPATIVTPTAVRVIRAMLEATRQAVNDSVVPVHTRYTELFRNECERRGLETLLICCDVQIESPEVINFRSLSDQEIRFWHALGYEVAGFPDLGEALRLQVHGVWLQARTELNLRDIEPDTLSELEFDRDQIDSDFPTLAESSGEFVVNPGV